MMNGKAGQSMMGGQGNQSMMGGQAGHGGQGGQDMMQKMKKMHSQMAGGKGMMGGQAGHGGQGGALMLKSFDADKDGTITPAEVSAGLKSFDKDGDGTLSIAEFEALHSKIIREKMVDRFQMIDNDGDGKVTSDEITVLTDRMTKMNKQRAEHHGQAADGAKAGQGMAGDGKAKTNSN